MPADVCDNFPIQGKTIYGRSPKMGDVRGNLQGYARCFPLQRYHSLRRLAESVVWAEILFTESASGANEMREYCVAATATLGLLLCLSLLPWPAVTELFSSTAVTPSFYGFEDSGDMFAAKEVFLSLKRAFVEPWTSSPMTAWPFFASLAILSERLADVSVFSPASSSMESLWKSWLISGNWSVPDVAGENYQRSSGACDAETALAAAHNAARKGSDNDLSMAVAAAQHVVLRCLEEFQDMGLVQLFTKPWATLWRGLDRLTAARDVLVSFEYRIAETRIQLSERSRRLLANLSKPVTFPMSLHPPHILGLTDAEDGYWFLADRIRAFEAPHCNPAFHAVAEMLDFHRTLVDGQWTMHFVDIGAHLGDCCLWAASRWSTGVRVLAIEMRKDNSAHIRRASKLARHPQGVLEVQEVQVVAEADCHLQEVSTVDCILDRWAQEVHLVSLYLGSGLELQVLRGSLRWLRAGRVQGVLLRSTTTEVELFEEFLKDHHLPYRIITLRVDHDLLFVKSGSFLDNLL